MGPRHIYEIKRKRTRSGMEEIGIYGNIEGKRGKEVTVIDKTARNSVTAENEEHNRKDRWQIMNGGEDSAVIEGNGENIYIEGVEVREGCTTEFGVRSG